MAYVQHQPPQVCMEWIKHVCIESIKYVCTEGIKHNCVWANQIPDIAIGPIRAHTLTSLDGNCMLSNQVLRSDLIDLTDLLKYFKDYSFVTSTSSAPAVGRPDKSCGEKAMCSTWVSHLVDLNRTLWAYASPPPLSRCCVQEREM